MLFKNGLFSLLIIFSLSTCANKNDINRTIQSDTTPSTTPSQHAQDLIKQAETVQKQKPTFAQRCGKLVTDRLILDIQLSLKANGEVKYRIFSTKTFMGRLLNTILPVFEKTLALDKVAKAMYRLEQNLDLQKPYFPQLAEAFELTAIRKGSNWDNIPQNKPIIFYANHTLSGADVFLLPAELQKMRPDLKIVAAIHSATVPGFKENAFVVNNKGTPEAKAQNKAVIAQINAHIKNNGALLIFPSGTTSAWKLPNQEYPVDSAYKTGILKMAEQSPETELRPVFLWGQPSVDYLTIRAKNEGLSRMFQFRELANFIGKPVTMTAGEPISIQSLKSKDQEKLNFLRRALYTLGKDYFETIAPGRSQEFIDFAAEQ